MTRCNGIPAASEYHLDGKSCFPNSLYKVFHVLLSQSNVVFVVVSTPGFLILAWDLDQIKSGRLAI